MFSYSKRNLSGAPIKMLHVYIPVSRLGENIVAMPDEVWITDEHLCHQYCFQNFQSMTNLSKHCYHELELVVFKSQIRMLAMLLLGIDQGVIHYFRSMCTVPHETISIFPVHSIYRSNIGPF
jgi:hypothetical protein